MGSSPSSNVGTRLQRNWRDVGTRQRGATVTVPSQSRSKVTSTHAKERAEPGFCRHTKDFVVGRRGFGSIKFFGEIDVQGLDLGFWSLLFNSIIERLLCIWMRPRNRQLEKYKEMLKRKADDQGVELVSYDPVKGEFQGQSFQRVQAWR